MYKQKKLNKIYVENWYVYALPALFLVCLSSNKSGTTYLPISLQEAGALQPFDSVHSESPMVLTTPFATFTYQLQLLSNLIEKQHDWWLVKPLRSTANICDMFHQTGFTVGAFETLVPIVAAILALRFSKLDGSGIPCAWFGIVHRSSFEGRASLSLAERKGKTPCRPRCRIETSSSDWKISQWLTAGESCSIYADADCDIS